MCQSKGKTLQNLLQSKGKALLLGSNPSKMSRFYINM